MSIRITSAFAHIRESRGFVRDEAFSGRSSVDKVHDPPNNYDLIDLMWRSDPVINTAFQCTVDMITRNGFDLITDSDDKARNKSDRKKLFKKLDDMNFTEVQDNFIRSWLIFGDAFIELRDMDNDGKPDELWTLETTEMRIAYDEHGTVLGYVQRPFNLTGLSTQEIVRKEDSLGIWFTPEEIIHLRLTWHGSSVYSQTPLEPIARSWSAKANALTYLDKILVNLPPELYIHLKGANRQQKEQFMELLYRRRSQAGLIPVSYGGEQSGLQIETINFDFNNGIFRVLEYLREEVLMVTRVPPVWVGMVDRNGANARNSEAQVFSFETRVIKLQSMLENYYNKHLLPKLGFDGWKLKYNPVSARSEKEALQNVAVLKSMNVKPEALVRYMKRKGISDFESKDFEVLDPMAMSGGNQSARNQLSPSRQPKEGRKDLSREGTSKDGGKKMDEQRSQVR